jgi:Sulfotransferase family
VENSRSVEPIFIVGVGRSGTTLLVNLLGAHPLLAPVYETPFIRKVIRHCEKVSLAANLPLFRMAPALFRRFLLKESKKLRNRLFAAAAASADPATVKQQYEAFPFGLAHCILYTPEEVARELAVWTDQLMCAPPCRDHVYRSARDFIDRVFSIHCSRLNKPGWVNKTPALLNYLDRLGKLYPCARCIHIVRDGRDSAVSMLSLPWGPKTVGESARHWKSHILAGRQKVRSTTINYTEIHYERLVESPAATLDGLLSFLKLEGKSTELLQSMPVTNTRIGQWRKQFTAGDRQVFAREAGDLLVDLGYETDGRWAS